MKPTEFIDTNWSDPNGDIRDNSSDSMLDFAFVADPAKDSNPVCRAIVREGKFPDDDRTSDHRPIELKLTPKMNAFVLKERRRGTDRKRAEELIAFHSL